MNPTLLSAQQPALPSAFGQSRNLSTEDDSLDSKIGVSLCSALLTIVLVSLGLATPSLAATAPAPVKYPVRGSQLFCSSPKFPEVPVSLKCVKIPQPYILDASGIPTPVDLFTTNPAGYPEPIPAGFDPVTQTTTDPNFTATTTIPSLIKNQAAAIALGKALFWDTQVGSDGLACASCHYSAGADPSRIQNQRNPGLRNASGQFASDGVTPIGNMFDLTNTGVVAKQTTKLLPNQNQGPNYTSRGQVFGF